MAMFYCRTRCRLPLYQAVPSLIGFLMVSGIAASLTRLIVFEMLGWLLHILIDIPMHSFRCYATRFLWPASDNASTASPGGCPSSRDRVA